MAEIKIAEAKKKTANVKNKDYQSPFTALKIDNIKKGTKTGEDIQTLIDHHNAETHHQAEGNLNHDGLKYNDGSLSPIIIPFEDAGYLQSLAVTDQQIH